MTTWEPANRWRLEMGIVRAFDTAGPILDRLDGCRAAWLELRALLPTLVAEARTGGATWQDIGAVLNLQADEVAELYAQAVADEARVRSDFDGAAAWKWLNS